nr:hypothetical protein PJ912_11080 [Pectobacterium colocasium]
MAFPATTVQRLTAALGVVISLPAVFSSDHYRLQRAIRGDLCVNTVVWRQPGYSRGDADDWVN